jgi:arginine/ornithine N-succinyltransferase beta subunit
VHAERDHIRTIVDSFVAPATDAGHPGPLLVSNRDLQGFRVTPVQAGLDEGARKRLGVERSDQVRCSPDSPHH